MNRTERETLTVKVRALGWTKNLLGSSEAEVLCSGRTLSDLLRTIGQKSGTSREGNLFLVLVNGRSVGSDDFQLSNGDTVALLPVVSGG